MFLNLSLAMYAGFQILDLLTRERERESKKDSQLSEIEGSLEFFFFSTLLLKVVKLLKDD